MSMKKYEYQIKSVRELTCEELVSFVDAKENIYLKSEFKNLLPNMDEPQYIDPLLDLLEFGLAEAFEHNEDLPLYEYDGITFLITEICGNPTALVDTIGAESLNLVKSNIIKDFLSYLETSRSEGRRMENGNVFIRNTSDEILRDAGKPCVWGINRAVEWALNPNNVKYVVYKGNERVSSCDTIEDAEKSVREMRDEVYFEVEF